VVSLGCQGASVVVLESEADGGAACTPDGGLSSNLSAEGGGDGAAKGAHGGTWATYAHDYQRTARADGPPGAITSPTVAWTRTMGGVLGFGQAAVGDVDGDGRPDVVTIAGGRATATKTDGSKLWQGELAGAGAVLGIWNLDGVGAPEVVVDTSGGVRVLDGVTGKEQTLLTTGLPSSAAFVPEGAAGGLLVLTISRTSMAAYDFRNGLQVTAPLWKNTTVEDPTDVVFGDVDGDGTLDLVHARNAGFEVLDPLTGATKYSDDPIGSVGFVYTFQLANVDGKPGDEIVVLDPSYIYSPSAGVFVLGVSGGALTTLWSSSVVTPVSLATQFTDVQGSVADLDGDGTLEAVFSQWDGASQTWTTHVVDAATGASIAALTGEVLQAVADVDGHGKKVIVTRSNPLADLTPARSDVRAYDFVSRATPPAVRPWTLSQAHVMLASTVFSHTGSADLPAVADFDPAPGDELLVGVDPGKTGADTELAVLRGDGTLASTWAVSASVTPSVLAWGAGLTGASSTADVLEAGNDGRVHALTKALAEHGSFATGSYTNWVDVFGLDTQRSIVAMATSTRDLLWLDGTHLHADGTPYQVVHHAGVVDTSASGAPSVTMTYLAGPSPTLVAFEQGDTAMTMVGLDTAGVEVWRTPLAAGGSLLMPWPWALDLTGDGFPDVLAPLFNVNSLESFAVFDGKTGAVVRSTPLQAIFPTGDQTMTGSLADVNGDGQPDLVLPVHSVAPVAIDLSKDPMTPIWAVTAAGSPPAISGTILAAPVDSSGVSLLRVNGNVGIGEYVRYSLGGVVQAHQDEGLGYVGITDANSVALVARTPGGKVFDMVAAGTSGAGLSRVRRIAGDTISTVWTVYAAGGVVTPTQPANAFALHDPIAVDVDGDGTDEVVFGSDDGWLYALHASDGSAAFALSLGAPVLHLAAADVDLDPAVELVASLGDGRLVAVDGAGKYSAVVDPPGDAGTDAGSSSGGPSCATPGATPAAGASGAGCACSAAGGAERSDGGGAGLFALAALGALAAARSRARV
jgi:hypothetical protein